MLGAHECILALKNGWRYFEVFGMNGSLFPEIGKKFP